MPDLLDKLIALTEEMENNMNKGDTYDEAHDKWVLSYNALILDEWRNLHPAVPPNQAPSDPPGHPRKT